MNNQGGSVRDRENSKCKGLKVEIGLICFMNRQKSKCCCERENDRR